MENNWNYSDLLNENTELIAYDDQFVMPAIHDNHVFFSGYLAMNAGIDLSDTSSANEAVERIKAVMNHKKQMNQFMLMAGMLPCGKLTHQKSY